MSESYSSYQPSLGIKGLVDNARNQVKTYKTIDFNPLNDTQNPNAVEGLKLLKKNLTSTQQRFSLISQVGQEYAKLYNHEKKLDAVSELLKNQTNGAVSYPHTPKMMQHYKNNTPSKNYFVAEITMPDKQNPPKTSASSEKEVTYKIVSVNLPNRS